MKKNPYNGFFDTIFILHINPTGRFVPVIC